MNCTTLIIEKYFIICDGKFITHKTSFIELIIMFVIICLFAMANARIRN